ncbi:proteobacterial dedicated sortase system response regulator [Teredinibacter waterburyi]|jgi:two component transcriptional regulator, winged helix family|uniref:proteobacterial dedicated sortase system response regulator n=1 Tax=Teredinibacter waterburyi TaxID=1500538 RepID=UPI00165FF31F|nr:proteobacterial dedicated sortase system response regulator [Teredinibacter waterburyi]
MSRHITIVEDEDAIAQNYADAMRRQGYKVSHYRNRPDALTAFATRLPDLAIIDVGLGDDIEGGFELCRELRSRAPQLPIIFLTARDSEFDMVSGLRLGADDYLTKDISLPHMLARITALFRRIDLLSQPSQRETELVREQLTLNMDRMTAYWNSNHVELTITEMWIVHALAQHPGHVKNRQQLMDAANVVLDDNTITSHIKRIRKKFREQDNSFDCIQTAYGMGYRWLNRSDN